MRTVVEKERTNERANLVGKLTTLLRVGYVPFFNRGETELPAACLCAVVPLGDLLHKKLAGFSGEDAVIIILAALHSAELINIEQFNYLNKKLAAFPAMLGRDLLLTVLTVDSLIALVRGIHSDASCANPVGKAGYLLYGLRQYVAWLLLP